MAASLAGGHSLTWWVVEFPSKSGLGSGYAGGTDHPRGAWKKRKSFVATHLVVGWVRGLLLVVRKARGWLHCLCVLCRMQTSLKTNFALLIFVQWVISRNELLYFLESALWNTFFFFFLFLQWASFQLVIYQQSILQIIVKRSSLGEKKKYPVR